MSDYTEIADQDNVSSWSLAWPVVLGGAALLGLGLYGIGKYKNNKALRISQQDRYRVKVRKALKDVSKLSPRNTFIATKPSELHKLLARFEMEDSPGEAGDYWMYPLYADDGKGGNKYWGAIVNAPQDDNGTVDIAGLRHELGHVRDYKNGDGTRDSNQGFWGELKDNLVGVVAPLHTAQGRKELRAWELSGVPKGDENRESALDTYRFHHRTRLLNNIGAIIRGDFGDIS